jgi:hypothetical protein
MDFDLPASRGEEMNDDQDMRDRLSALSGETCSIWVNPWADSREVARDLRQAADDVEQGRWDKP